MLDVNVTALPYRSPFFIKKTVEAQFFPSLYDVFFAFLQYSFLFCNKVASNDDDTSVIKSTHNVCICSVYRALSTQHQRNCNSVCIPYTLLKQSIFIIHGITQCFSAVLCLHMMNARLRLKVVAWNSFVVLRSESLKII